jgi:hypothetical protein
MSSKVAPSSPPHDRELARASTKPRGLCEESSCREASADSMRVAPVRRGFKRLSCLGSLGLGSSGKRGSCLGSMRMSGSFTERAASNALRPPGSARSGGSRSSVVAMLNRLGGAKESTDKGGDEQKKRIGLSIGALRLCCPGTHARDTC